MSGPGHCGLKRPNQEHKLLAEVSRRRVGDITLQLRVLGVRPGRAYRRGVVTQPTSGLSVRKR